MSDPAAVLVPRVPDVLAEICQAKREHVAACKRERPLPEIERLAAETPPPRGFARALRRTHAEGRFALIAEVKKASPSKGLIRADFDPTALGRAYAAGGASCLSVLTDGPYFQGQDEYLGKAREASGLPALRKDFTLDPYQVAEARALGADAVLVIMAALDDPTAATLIREAARWGMDALIEVHDGEELERALALDPDPAKTLLGVNNRNLKTLDIDLATFERLSARVPEGFLKVAESGLHGHDDLRRMADAGAGAFLVGESLMRQADVTAATRALLGLAP